jgi:hypothetical protein
MILSIQSIFTVSQTTKFCVFFIIFLSYVLISESLPHGTEFLSCPNGEGLINCDEIKCCPLHNTTCCLDEPFLNKGIIRIACASIFPRGHPLGC